MAFIGLKVPHETARLLGQIKVEGEKVDLSEMHVTVLFLGSDLPIETIAKATQVAYEVTCRTKPFTVATKLVTSFPQNPDGIPVIARVESGALHVLRGALTAAFDAAGITYDKKYPDYQPHVTLAYLRGALSAPPDMNLPSLEWGAGELVLWGGDRGDDKLTVTFPFALTPSKTATYRAFVRQAALLARRKEAGPGAIERKILQTAKENRGVDTVVVEHTTSTRRGGGGVNSMRRTGGSRRGFWRPWASQGPRKNEGRVDRDLPASQLQDHPRRACRAFVFDLIGGWWVG